MQKMVTGMPCMASDCKPWFRVEGTIVAIDCIFSKEIPRFPSIQSRVCISKSFEPLSHTSHDVDLCTHLLIGCLQSSQVKKGTCQLSPISPILH